jgi:hypothetical protein
MMVRCGVAAVAAMIAVLFLTLPASAQQGRDQDMLKAQDFETRGMTAEARAIYEKLYRETPNDMYFWKLILLYERTADYKSMEEIARKKLETVPGDISTLNYLSKALRGMGEPARQHGQIVGKAFFQRLAHNIVDDLVMGERRAPCARERSLVKRPWSNYYHERENEDLESSQSSPVGVKRARDHEPEGDHEANLTNKHRGKREREAERNQSRTGPRGAQPKKKQRDDRHGGEGHIGHKGERQCEVQRIQDQAEASRQCEPSRGSREPQQRYRCDGSQNP